VHVGVYVLCLRQALLMGLRLAEGVDLERVERIADSCGYGVPLMSFEGVRPHHDAWAAKRLRVGGAGALLAYQAEQNATSIDGLPAVDVAVADQLP